jgi:hypothetical protein
VVAVEVVEELEVGIIFFIIVAMELVPDVAILYIYII